MQRQDSLLINDALFHQQAPTNFSLMVKPVGSTCNLNCKYCYYLEKADYYEHWEPIMSKSLLEKLIKQHIEANDIPEVSFVWHGGEPLLAGYQYFRKINDLQKKYANGKKIFNSIQTNGLLIDEQWCDFFAANHYLVGISIDGPESIHNANRSDKIGRATFFKVIRTITLMQQKQVEFNTLSVVSNICEGKGVEIYNFFKSIGSRYMQFIPAFDRYREHNMNHENDTGYEHDIDAIKYGEFLIDIFDEWKKEDIGEYYVTVFDAVLARWCNITPGSCVFADRCNGGLTIEHNGDVFSCDHFVYPKNLLGNINDTNLKDIFHSNNNFEFGLKKRYNLSSECLSCKYLNICLGDCPKNRKPADKGSQFLPSGLCAGLKLFFSHTESFMKQMRDDILRH